MARQVGDNGKSKASGRARDVTKGVEILQRVSAGATVTAASKAVGVSQHHGSKLYIQAMQNALASQSDLRREMLAQDIETLRQLLAAHMPLAVGQVAVLDEDGYVIDDGDDRRVDLRHVVVAPPSFQSAKVVLAVLDRRAKLLGLDAAIRVEISNTKVAETVDEVDRLIDEADTGELAEVLPIDARRLAR